MTPEEREAFYDREIAPALADLARRCTANGLSFLAAVQYDAEEDGTPAVASTHMGAEGESLQFKLIHLLARCRGNFDEFALAVARHVRRSGEPHSSAVLVVMGVDPDPARRGE